MKGFHSLKEGCVKFYPVLRGGRAKRFGPVIFPFCRPPSPLLMTGPYDNYLMRIDMTVNNREGCQGFGVKYVMVC